MAEFAYIDSNRTDRIYPEEALLRGRGNHYYCPNPKCNAWLRAVRSDDKKHPNPFFSAFPSHKHIEGCDYKAYYDEESQRDKNHQNNIGLHEDDFLIEKLYEKVIAEEKKEEPDDANSKAQGRTDNKRESLISSTGKLARFCIAHDIDENLGEAQICDFLIDSRTANERYRQFINVENGNKVFLLILPLYRMNYDKDKSRCFLSLQEKYKDGASVDFRFEIKFKSNELFWDFIATAFDYRDTKSKVAILTKMTKYYGNDDHYICDVVTEKQCWLRLDNSLV